MGTAGPQTGKLLGVSFPGHPPEVRRGQSTGCPQREAARWPRSFPLLPTLSSCCCCSVAKLCQTLQTHGLRQSRLPVLHYLPVCSNPCIILYSTGFHFHHQMHPQLSSVSAWPSHFILSGHGIAPNKPLHPNPCLRICFLRNPNQDEPNESPSSSASLSFYATPSINKAWLMAFDRLGSGPNSPTY